MAKSNKPSETPLMKQYNRIKAKHPTALLLFRVGDFYETFGSDAIKASKILGIILTKRKNGSGSHIELAGFPHHSLDTYLPKLVRAGQRVAICDQLEDPKQTKTIVKRGVTELVTPGVSYNDKTYDQNSNNFLAAVYLDKKSAGISFLDISTGEFLVAEGSFVYIDKLLQSFEPNEVLYQRNKKSAFEENFGTDFNTFQLEDWVFDFSNAENRLKEHFQTASLKGYGIEDMSAGITAAGSVFSYLNETEHHQIQHISKISRIESDKYVWLDRFTIRNLEIFKASSPNGQSLIQTIDKCITPMGARLLKRWLALPLKDKTLIEKRLEVVSYLVNNDTINEWLSSEFKSLGDLERLISKVSFGRVNPRELLYLFKGLEFIPKLKTQLNSSGHSALKLHADQLNICKEITERIGKTLNPEAPVQLSKGNVIKSGVNAELDELRELMQSGKSYLIKIQEREIENTGISSLKIGFNGVFGYFLEVTHTHKDKVPSEWVRKQTLTGSERYITEELKTYETKILGAEEKIAVLEFNLYHELVAAVSGYTKAIQQNSEIIAQLDTLLSFANHAIKEHYTQPKINDGFDLAIQDGRHPVIEKMLPIGEEYIANDVFLDRKSQQILMITGPNMAGKSAYLRQNALIVLLAQIGSFVPAKAAEIGLVDKIFTRVGASDNISQGESTFMVEMNETASILNNITERSMIILDEIGRGTSTYDGISIAWAIAEFLHEHKCNPKTLFATHYHELNDMCKLHKRIKNYNVSIKEHNKKIIFLRKIIPGGSEHSFGIHVAKMAGMPVKVLNKANKILVGLEKNHSGGAKNVSIEPDLQMSFFQLDDPTLTQIKEEIINIDIDTLTPVEALLKLNEIKSLLKG